ncbi:MAG: PSD1 domain-containing protein [Verrucomicrobia bacterium]|nr:PSD1 domain-containing protein [Verrucomicrobiota bacterium]
MKPSCSKLNFMSVGAFLIGAFGLLATSNGAGSVDFNRDIRPILSDHCFQCHGPDEKARKAKLRLDTREDAIAAREEGAAIVPGKSSESKLIERIRSTDPDEVMPPPKTGKKLTPEQAARLKRWIDEGAAYQGHWSFTPPRRTALPPVKARSWPRNEIDHFILARLEQQDLKPSPEADRYTLIRRLSLDLVGLPPSIAEADAFVLDRSPDAYEKLAERLLASPAFGEHWGRLWLDLARFADSAGYGSDPLRPMWRYRDWVIEAFNRNVPFDQFTIEQLAGDLLPNPSLDQMLATAFHRNSKTNTEGGTDDEEFRVEAVKDRVDTTIQVWMGLTMGCAKCHTHKYDPITQKEYYELMAIFNQTEDADASDFSPKILTPTPPQAERLAKLQKELKIAETPLREMTPERQRTQREWETRVLEDIRARPPRWSDWQAAGPFPATSIFDAFGREFEPEKRVDPKQTFLDGTLAWQVKTEWSDGEVHNLSDVVGATYLYRSLQVDVPLTISLSLGSNDGIKVWLDREEKLSHRVNRDAAPDQETLSFLVQPGEHSLLVKISNFGGPSAFYFKTTRAGLPEAAESGLRKPADKRSGAERDAIVRFYESVAPELKPLRDTYQAALAAKDKFEASIAKTPITRELAPEKRRATHVLTLANFLMKGQEVSPGVPKAFHSLPEGAPTNRLGVALWLMSAENPLTARVQANRFWSQFFGRGLVETEEDFGSKGMLPTHPELLDWLAVEFRESGWDVKALLKCIVTSATYRQASIVTPELLAADPDNRLYARGPRIRLKAETIRDQALAVSGLLCRKLGGPSVFPPQPEGLWQAAFNGERTWKTSTGEDRYLRGIYTFLRRTVPYPSMATFDAPSRETCTIRRQPTNTPLQAFVTLNDPAFFEMAQALALRLWKEGGLTVADRVQYGLRLTLLRHPLEPQARALEELFASEAEHYRQDVEAAKKVLQGMPGGVPVGADSSELAAWVVVSSVLLNMDALLMKG